MDKQKLRKWIRKNYLNLAIFNGIVMILVLLRSAGYFDPYFPITVNVIVFISLVLSIILLGANSRVLFAVATSFWIFAAFLRIVGINIWAERTAIYVYESLSIGVALLVKENFSKGNKYKN